MMAPKFPRISISKACAFKGLREPVKGVQQQLIRRQRPM